ncbi:MAG TPA: PEPxxWA-CTERM sorting domain-containing protein [Sphingomonas sp.]|uniref:PEPxxWA-CTERM sorting domain-containing protein n=1 Tax=Sphingomonas sp. TaxID=28214 RepID=UPI002C194724|nr:PEPxxWA-CTERM sorting domain-containing protein [Sphingomonas sp.]HMI20648.1 PEPxxWA-CTERM sorting domain-containing protein [Sphingomonas sp.]
MKFRILAAICGASLACGAAQAQNLLTNGSFELFDADHPYVPDGNDTDTFNPGSTGILGWTVTAGTNISVDGPTNPFGEIASDGSYSLDLTGYADSNPFGGVSQSIATVAGQHYRLTFDLGNNVHYVNEAYDLAILASAGATSQTFTNPVYQQSFNPVVSWATETMDFVATGSSTLITLHGGISGANQAAIGLDNVSVVQLDSSAAPEPASWALMLGGFGMVGGALRSRKRAAVSFG